MNGASILGNLQQTIQTLHDVQLELDVDQYIVDDEVRREIPGAREGSMPRAALLLASASGLTSITLLSAGPCLSISWMRARYFSVRERAVNLPDFIPRCNSAMVNSSSSKGRMFGAAGTSKA